jgi:hypothetical protein
MRLCVAKVWLDLNHLAILSNPPSGVPLIFPLVERRAYLLRAHRFVPDDNIQWLADTSVFGVDETEPDVLSERW